MDCPLCISTGGEVLWQDAQLRVVQVEDADYHGYCRVIWRAHVAEMTDLDEAQRNHFMHVVFATEAAVRDLLRPDKINLASLGNFTPHLHWHVIARFRDERAFSAIHLERAATRDGHCERRKPSQLPQSLAKALLSRLKGLNFRQNPP